MIAPALLNVDRWVDGQVELRLERGGRVELASIAADLGVGVPPEMVKNRTAGRRSGSRRNPTEALVPVMAARGRQYRIPRSRARRIRARDVARRLAAARVALRLRD